MTSLSNSRYSISGDVDVGRGQLGLGWAGTAVTGTLWGLGSNRANHYLINCVSNITITLPDVGTGSTQAQPGYWVTVANTSSSSTITINNFGGTTLNVLSAGKGAMYIASTAVTNNWFIQYDTTSYGGVTNLQQAYNASATTDPQILLSTTFGAIKINDASTAQARLFTLRNNAGSFEYFRVGNSTGGSQTPCAAFFNGTNGATGTFVVGSGTANGANSMVFGSGTATGPTSIIFGSGATAAAATNAFLVGTGNANAASTVVFGSGTATGANSVIFGSGQTSAAGTNAVVFGAGQANAASTFVVGQSVLSGANSTVLSDGSATFNGTYTGTNILYQLYSGGSWSYSGAVQEGTTKTSPNRRTLYFLVNAVPTTGTTVSPSLFTTTAGTTYRVTLTAYGRDAVNTSQVSATHVIEALVTNLSGTAVIANQQLRTIETAGYTTVTSNATLVIAATNQVTVTLVAPDNTNGGAAGTMDYRLILEYSALTE